MPEPRRWDAEKPPDPGQALLSAAAALERAWKAAKELGDEESAQEIQRLGKEARALLERYDAYFEDLQRRAEAAGLIPPEK